MSVDKDCFSLLFAIQKRSSLIARRDEYGHLLLFVGDSMSIDQDYLVSILSTRGKRARWHVETNVVICFFFVEDSMSIDRDYFSLHIIIQRQSSPMTHRDQHGCLHPLSKTQCLLTKTTLVSISSTRGKRARWHAKTNVVICSFRRPQYLSTETIAVSTSSTGGKQACWHAETK